MLQKQFLFLALVVYVSDCHMFLMNVCRKFSVDSIFV